MRAAPSASISPPCCPAGLSSSPRAESRAFSASSSSSSATSGLWRTDSSSAGSTRVMASLRISRAFGMRLCRLMLVWRSFSTSWGASISFWRSSAKRAACPSRLSSACPQVDTISISRSRCSGSVVTSPERSRSFMLYALFNVERLCCSAFARSRVRSSPNSPRATASSSSPLRMDSSVLCSSSSASSRSTSVGCLYRSSMLPGSISRAVSSCCA